MMTVRPDLYQPGLTAPLAQIPDRPNDFVSVADVELVTADDVSITAKCYRGSGPVEMTVLMLPGIGVPQRAFRHLAHWLAQRGARCVTVDYRGIGESMSRNGIEKASLSAWARVDAATAMQYCQSLGPEPVVLIGHSFGGQSVGISKALHDVRAAVFVGSQFGLARYWDGAASWQLAAYWHIALPLIAALFRVTPRWSGPAGPLPKGVAREWGRWGRATDWYVSHIPEAADLLASFDAPVLAYGMTDDPIAPPRAVSAFLEKFAATVPDRRDIGPEQLGLERLGHVGLLRPAGGVEAIWEEMLEFLQDKIRAGRTESVPSAA